MSGTQSVDRAADLLKRVVVAQEAVSFTDLVEDCGYARSTTSRLLSALERAELIDRDDAGRWRPGGLFDLYAARQDSVDRLVEVARPVMEHLGELTGETVNLAIARGGTVLQVAQVDSRFFLGARDWVGVEVPAHCSALGKALYAGRALALPEDPIEQLTSSTIRTRRELADDVARVRARGWAVTLDELEDGLTGVGAAIQIDSRTIAALGISGPTSRLADTLDDVGRAVRDHANTISDALSMKDGAA